MKYVVSSRSLRLSCSDSLSRPSLSVESFQVLVVKPKFQTTERAPSVGAASTFFQSQSVGEHLPHACTNNLLWSAATENFVTLRVAGSSFFQSPKYGDGAGVSAAGGFGIGGWTGASDGAGWVRSGMR